MAFWGPCHDCSNHSNLEMEAECLTKNFFFYNNMMLQKLKVETENT